MWEVKYYIKNTVNIYSEGHRPLWPIFGEYQFVPPQRWLHNVEVRPFYEIFYYNISF